jgi:(p)ppGpp synthase/HD superfamily hydrolase
MPDPTPCYGPRLGEALKFAADQFRFRRRKGSDQPYLTHLLAVATLVMEHGGTEDQVIAAVLHDYLEDIPGASHDELATRFGERVAAIVETLSDATDAQNKAPWKPRKERYLARLREASEEVKLVSAADKLHNAVTILRDRAEVGDAVFARFSVPRDETLWYYREVVRALSHRYAHPLVDRVRAAVIEMHRVTGVPDDLA